MGTLYVSHDGGASWTTVTDMDGQSIRALEQARSNSKVFIAGTLKGVYRSDDSGAHWKQISPADSHEIHEVESIAIDPADPQTRSMRGPGIFPGRRPTAASPGAT